MVKKTHIHYEQRWIIVRRLPNTSESVYVNIGVAKKIG